MKFTHISAIALMAIATPVFAQEKSPPKDAAAEPSTQYYTNVDKSDFEASDLIGARVYTTQGDVVVDKPIDKADANWTDIGEINDIVIGKNGSVKAVVLGVGGFLAIGEKNVAVKMSDLKFVKKAGDDADDYFIVVKGDKASLEKAPAYERKD